MSHLREVMDQHWLVRNQQQIKNTSIIWLTLLYSYDPKKNYEVQEASANNKGLIFALQKFRDEWNLISCIGWFHLREIMKKNDQKNIKWIK